MVNVNNSISIRKSDHVSNNGPQGQHKGTVATAAGEIDTIIRESTKNYDAQHVIAMDTAIKITPYC